MAISTGERRTHVGYDFDPQNPRWQVFGETDNRFLTSAPPPSTLPSRLSTEEQLARELHELDRRIAREPALLEHRRAKASLLQSLGRLEESRATIQAAAVALPQNFWPPLALAALDATPAAREHFAAWSTANPSFTHQYYLSLLDRQIHDDASALHSVEKSLDFPIEVSPDDPNILAFYLWDMTRYALAQKEFPLVLRLSDAWQRADTTHQLDEKSYLPLRAAALLAMHDQLGAQTALAVLHRANATTWAQNIPNLDAAVTRADFSYTYDPGASPSRYSIFALPN